MRCKGSITIFLCLMLTIMISLVTASVYSVRVSACRMQLANVSDQAMFSLFARYDRDLLDKYDVFFIDGGLGAGDLHLEKCVDRLNEAMEPLLAQQGLFGKNLTNLSIKQTAITAYTLATDATGAAYGAQAVDYMKDTLALQSIGTLMNETRQNATKIDRQERSGENSSKAVSDSSFDQLEEESAQAKAEAAAKAEAEEAAREDSGEDDSLQLQEEEPAEEIKVPDNFVNPLPEIRKVGRMSILNLVVQDPSLVSGTTVNRDELLSARNKESGIGLVNVKTSVDDSENSLLFNEYILSHFGTYRNPSDLGDLTYQGEYILEGKDSDISNLEGVVTRLLLTRFGTNLALLYSNAALRAQATAAADVIASVMILPQAASIIESLLIFGWAYCESLVDVRGLLDGDKIPLMKTESNWQVQLSDLPTFSSNMDALRTRSTSGMNYEAYLRVFLFLENADTRVSRSMDMVEDTIRSSGRDDFRLDLCFDSMTVSVTALAEGKQSLIAEKKLCYRDL